MGESEEIIDWFIKYESLITVFGFQKHLSILFAKSQIALI